MILALELSLMTTKLIMEHIIVIYNALLRIIGAVMLALLGVLNINTVIYGIHLILKQPDINNTQWITWSNFLCVEPRTLKFKI